MVFYLAALRPLGARVGWMSLSLEPTILAIMDGGTEVRGKDGSPWERFEFLNREAKLIFWIFNKIYPVRCTWNVVLNRHVQE
jgi:hypothetical protein